MILQKSCKLTPFRNITPHTISLQSVRGPWGISYAPVVDLTGFLLSTQLHLHKNVINVLNVMMEKYFVFKASADTQMSCILSQKYPHQFSLIVYLSEQDLYILKGHTGNHVHTITYSQ